MLGSKSLLGVSDMTRKVCLKIGRGGISTELQESFLQVIKEKKIVSAELGEKVLISQFIDAAVEMIAMASEPNAFKTIGYFYTLLKNGLKVFLLFPLKSAMPRLLGIQT